MKIYTPIKDVNGIYASVLFVNGVGETDNLALIEWFKNHGYKVEESTAISYDTQTWETGENETVEEPELDFVAMTPNDLRDWMREHGYGSKIKNIRNKEKLLEILRG